MAAIAKRQQLINYLADTTDKKVNALYTLLEEEIKENTFILSNEHLQILKNRESDHLSGKTHPIPWQEAHKQVRNKNKNA